MRKLFHALLLLTALSAFNNNVYAQRFRPLFNGKNLKGWEIFFRKVEIRDL